ncbi:MAG: 2-phosphosulfolactate phosphatase [Planctomycetia bacterium]|nr:2-phosphosulfolactate phosphatase [Planctomycetia bacterium]
MQHPLRWHCHDLSAHVRPDDVVGHVAVIIDVLRASTTMTTALAHGAAGVRPMLTVEQARAAAGPGVLLGGERGCVRIPGFDLGNSPLDYVPDVVAGRRVVITTTNGTAALERCRAAREVLVGAMVNRSAVACAVRVLAGRCGSRHVHLVCAGTDGAVSGDDVLTAGAILDAAAADPAAVGDELDAPARAALESFRALCARGGLVEEMIDEVFRHSPGGVNLVALGMAADLAAAAAIDSLTLVPRLDHATGWLHAFPAHQPATEPA